jgi:ABC-type transport system involved in cytochrome bd biosynthesis fused ATPase/permease subunit
MNNCFLGFLKNKTRVLFTNSLKGLDKVDRIIVLDRGEIIEEGPYKDMYEKY